MSILNARKVPIDYTRGQSEALVKVQNVIDELKARMKDTPLDVDGFPKDPDKYINEIFVLKGYSGTGKSTITENIMRYSRQVGYAVQVVAPTNKACNVLKQKLATADVTTLHSLLYGQPDDDSGENWTLKVQLSNSVIIADECSMIDKQLFNDLMSACVYNNVIIFTGDTFQLEPVGNDSGVFKLPNSYTLTEVKRQSNTSPILKLATVIRTVEKRISYTEHEDEQFYVYRSVHGMLNEYSKMYQDEKDCIFITDTNKKRIDFNNQLRRLLGFNHLKVGQGEQLISISNGEVMANGETFKLGIITEPKEVQITFKDYYQTDVNITCICFMAEMGEMNVPVVLLKDYEKPSFYQNQLWNIIYQQRKETGSSSLIDALPELEITQEQKGIGSYNMFEGEMRTEKKFNKRTIIASFGYAISCHKSQGSQWEYVFVYQSWGQPKWNVAKWFYTAITRSSKFVAISADTPDLVFKSNKAVNEKYETILQEQEEANREIEF